MADAKPDEETRKFPSLKLDLNSKKMALDIRGGLEIAPPPKYLCTKHGIVEFAIVSNIKGKPGAWCQICHVEWLDENITKVQPVTEKPEKPKPV